ncbi:hypothetical protein ACFQ1S_28750 [Kibdelosporangium lantanae]|uniref:Uncharacterized protein n=1 Tax=Kibdelosporangium lantanae TaxID=1497396 RepID=A0ABW3MGM9_9PSEU
MKKLIAALAAAVAFTGVGAQAHADPVGPSQTWCGTEYDWKNEVYVQACLRHQGYDYGARWEWVAEGHIRDKWNRSYPVKLQLVIISSHKEYDGPESVVQLTPDGIYASYAIPSVPLAGPKRHAELHVLEPANINVAVSSPEVSNT